MNNQNDSYNIENTAELMTRSGKGNKTAIMILAIVAIILLLAIAAISINAIVKKPSISEQIPGKWIAEYDLSQLIMSELGDSIGIDLSLFKPKPIYCYYILEFDNNGNFALYMDAESLATAIGDFIKPYISSLLDMDIDGFYDFIMPYLVDDLPIAADNVSGTYKVDEENQKVLLFVDGEDYGETIYIDSDGYLRFDNPEIGDGIAFKKE